MPPVAIARWGAAMKWGFRKPSLRKRIAARTSWKRYVRHSLGFKAPRGWGWLTNPRRAAYNRLYRRTTFGLGDLFKTRRRRTPQAGCLVMLVLSTTALTLCAAVLAPLPIQKFLAIATGLVPVVEQFSGYERRAIAIVLDGPYARREATACLPRLGAMGRPQAERSVLPWANHNSMRRCSRLTRPSSVISAMRRSLAGSCFTSFIGNHPTGCEPPK
jgi:hypothetical protein